MISHKKNFDEAQDETTINTGINHLELLKNESLQEIRGISFAEPMDKGGGENMIAEKSFKRDIPTQDIFLADPHKEALARLGFVVLLILALSNK
jgi:hypothetical protein